MNRPKVKRVVITFSLAAILTPQPADPKTGAAYTYTEADWNTVSPQIVEEQGGPLKLRLEVRSENRRNRGQNDGTFGPKICAKRRN